MQLTQITTLAAFMVGPALARLNYGKAVYDSGNKQPDNAIWISGENACQYTYLGNDAQSPCDFNGGHFTASNGFSYILQGCGGSDFRLLNGDGSFNSEATFDPSGSDGSGCNNQFGNYRVDRQYHFG